MLSELSIKLIPPTGSKIGYLQSSIFQGILMEMIDPDYASSIHEQGLHPYSQWISSRDELIWNIRALNDSAYKGVIEPLLSPSFDKVELKSQDITLEIAGKTLITKKNEELMKTFTSDNTERYVKVSFESPTAFKSDSNYVFMPDPRLIFGSLMRKYSASSDSTDMTDEETLEYISAHTSIVDFKIRSTRFPLEKVKIPSFMGEITLHFSGTDTMARYAKMLLEFGEFSGVGIKCGMGMGAIKIIRKEA